MGSTHGAQSRTMGESLDRAGLKHLHEMHLRKTGERPVYPRFSPEVILHAWVLRSDVEMRGRTWILRASEGEKLRTLLTSQVNARTFVGKSEDHYRSLRTVRQGADSVRSAGRWENPETDPDTPRFSGRAS